MFTACLKPDILQSSDGDSSGRICLTDSLTAVFSTGIKQVGYIVHQELHVILYFVLFAGISNRFEGDSASARSVQIIGRLWCVFHWNPVHGPCATVQHISEWCSLVRSHLSRYKSTVITVKCLKLNVYDNTYMHQESVAFMYCCFCLVEMKGIVQVSPSNGWLPPHLSNGQPSMCEVTITFTPRYTSTLLMY